MLAVLAMPAAVVAGKKNLALKILPLLVLLLPPPLPLLLIILLCCFRFLHVLATIMSNSKSKGVLRQKNYQVNFENTTLLGL